MKSINMTILKAISSDTRYRIIDCLLQGIDHPDEIAKKIQISRQGVESHLEELKKIGIVNKNTNSPLVGRTKVVYEINGAGKHLLKSIDKEIDGYRNKITEIFNSRERELDAALVKGEINEKVWNKRKKQLKKEMQLFLP